MNQLGQLVRDLQNVLYGVTREDGTHFLDTNKEWNSDTLQELADLVEKYHIKPQEGQERNPDMNGSRCDWEFDRCYAVPARFKALANCHILDDTSWHNDTCPSFGADAETISLRIWCDHPNPANREMPGMKRFMVEQFPRDNNLETKIIFETDSEEEIVRFVEDWVSQNAYWHGEVTDITSAHKFLRWCVAFIGKKFQPDISVFDYFRTPSGNPTLNESTVWRYENLRWQALDLLESEAPKIVLSAQKELA
jgi:hypothetical protein